MKTLPRAHPTKFCHFFGKKTHKNVPDRHAAMCPFSKIAKSGKSLHPTLHPLYITHLSTSLIDPYGLHHFVPSAFQILPLCNTISSVYLTTAVSISVYIIWGKRRAFETILILSAIEEGLRQKKWQRSSLLYGGKNLFNSLPC